MKILVNANALIEKGGISVLNNFINDIQDYEYINQNNIHVSIIVPNSWNENKIIKNERIKIIKLELKKNSYLRKIENNIKVKKLIKENKYDVYLSLQNTALRNTNIPQFVLIHTALPFVNIPKEYNIFKYRVMLKIYYKININKYDGIFVQTEWMKEIINKNFKFDSKKTWVVRPQPNDIRLNTQELDDLVINKLETGNIKLLYPARNEKYKNINRLIDAVNLYNSNCANKKVTLYLTYDGIDTEYVKYIGNIKYSSIATLYKKIDAIIFPSLVESLGLPIQEALILEKDILVSKLNYSEELLGKHDYYFDPYDVHSIKDCIDKYCNTSRRRKQTNFSVSGSYRDFIRIIFEDFNKRSKYE